MIVDIRGKKPLGPRRLKPGVLLHFIKNTTSLSRSYYDQSFMYMKALWNRPCAAPLTEWRPLCWVCCGEHKVRAAKMFCSINKITSSYRGSPPAVIQIYKKSVIWAGCLSLNTWMSKSTATLKGHATPNFSPRSCLTIRVVLAVEISTFCQMHQVKIECEYSNVSF